MQIMDSEKLKKTNSKKIQIKKCQVSSEENRNVVNVKTKSQKVEDDNEPVKNIINKETVSEIPAERCYKRFSINIEIDMMVLSLFVVALATRMYKLEEPRSIVFDELHYGKFVSLYMRRTFFFDAHPPLGKQLVAAVAYIAGYDGQFKFDRIGTVYPESVPLFALRLVPALCGSLIIPVAYYIILELGLSQWTAVVAAFMLLCDNALLTQSRFILMEPMLLLFALFGLLCVLKFCCYHSNQYCVQWWLWLTLGSASLTCAVCVKYVGFFSCCLGLSLVGRDFWQLLSNKKMSDCAVFCNLLARLLIVVSIPAVIYLAVFYIHLNVLTKAGPHDTVMTSAFQASLEGGLASITRGQPLEIAHGSQITLRHTHGRTCWLHSHNHVYPLRYPDKRGSSHQQQVTCYSFKDVNNWWIVKRPERSDFAVSQPVDAIRHGDTIQLIHGMSSRALNSHDVAAPVSPQNQEVSCYIDYNVSMPAQNLWRVDIINREQTGDVWHTIESHVHLIHVNSSQALKFSGRQLPDWGFNQHEVVTDRIVNQDDTIWNVEEHRYTKNEDQKDRERELVNAEMIPLRATTLSFWEKFIELQYKMLFAIQENVQNHMYSSEPFEWPFMTRGIAYWVSPHSNAQIHLIGNIVVWLSGTTSLVIYFILFVFYLMRRRRMCFDLPTDLWNRFLFYGQVFFIGYLFHYVPFFFVDRTLFLHHYLPAFTYKVLLTSALVEHIFYLFRVVLRRQLIVKLYLLTTVVWLAAIFIVFRQFSVLSYGTTELSAADILRLHWQESWDFIIHRE